MRAVTHPFPGAFTDLGDQRLFIWRARPQIGSCAGVAGQVISNDPLIVCAGDGALEILDWSAKDPKRSAELPAVGLRLG